MTKGTDLYRLQTLDSEKDTQQRRLTEVEDALGESKALRHAKKSLEAAQKSAQKLATRQRDVELQVQGVLEKVSRSEQRLYSGTVKNPKELVDLQSELAALHRRRQKLEDDLLEIMIELEEAEAARAQAQEHLDDAEAEWSTQQTALLAERDVLQASLAEIEQAQNQVLPRIDQVDLDTYQSLRRRKGGLAVVQMQGSACGGCGVAVSPNLKWKLRQGEFIRCGNCERIIV